MSRKLRFDLTVESNALLCPNPQEFYSKAYISENIVDNFRTLAGIKTATKIANVLFDDLLKAQTCSFNASGADLDAVDIDVCGFSAMAEICRFDVETSFLANQMASGSGASFEVQPFMSYYWDEMAKEIGEELSVIRWQGDAGSTSSYVGLCDGHLLRLEADATVIDINATASITSTNVIGEMTKVYQALPAKVRSKKSALRFHVSGDIYAAYELAAAAGNTLTFVTTTLGDLFLGVKLVLQEGLPNRTMVLTLKDNLIYAFDGIDDQKALKAINLEDTVAEPVLRTRVELKAGFYHVNGAEIVLYNPA